MDLWGYSPDSMAIDATAGVETIGRVYEVEVGGLEIEQAERRYKEA